MEAGLTVQAERENLAVLRDFVCARLRAAGVPTNVSDDVIQAVDEAACNIITHGYRGAPGPIMLELVCDGGTITARLTDQAPLFDPTRLPPAKKDRPPEERAAGGMGVLLMRAMVDSISYRVTADGSNELTLQKSYPP